MNVTGTLSPAWQRTKRVLFRPFDIGTWFQFGVIFFIQSLVEGGGGNAIQVPSSSKRGSGGAAPAPFDLKELVDQAHKWIADNMSTVVIFAVLGAIIGLALALVFMWLGTRGQMMSIRAVATGRPAIGEHWRETRSAGWKLFKANLVLAAIGLVVWGPLVVLGIYRFVNLVDSGVTDADALVLAMIPFVVVGTVLAIVFAILEGILRNLIAPVMLRFDTPAMAAWSRFRAAAPGSVGAILLFFLIRFGLSVLAGIVGTVVVLCTCCLGALPVVHQAIMSPWYFFERAYGLYAIESCGPDMKMMEELPETALPPHPPAGYPPVGPPLPQTPWGQS